MYSIICIVDMGHYERATKQDFPSIEAARIYKATIEKSREAIIIPTYVVDKAIELNNKRLEKESK